MAHIFTYENSWQQHLEKKLGLKPIMDNGYGGKEYEIDKKRTRPPRAPRSLSAATRSKLSKVMKDMHQKRVLRSQNKVTTVKPDKKYPIKGKTINHHMRATK